ncbi:MAG TPA: hypothetical protein VFZ78_01560, partial [Flavisolibacter sp.]
MTIAGLLSVAPHPKYRFTIFELEFFLIKRVSPVAVSHIELPNVANAYTKNNAKTPVDIKNALRTLVPVFDFLCFIKPNREVVKSIAMGMPK